MFQRLTNVCRFRRIKLHYLLLPVAATLSIALGGISARSQEMPARRIYVPVEDLDVVLRRDQRGVLLPREEFSQLYAAAKKNSSDAPRVPQGAILSSARYVGRISGDQLLITATMKFSQFTVGWQALTLQFEGLSVERATIGEQSARLGRDPKRANALVLFHDKVGTHTLTLELSTSLTSAGSDRLAGFGLTSTPSASLELELPAGRHLMVGGVMLERPNPDDQPANYQVAVGGKPSIALRITGREAEQGRDALVFGETAIGVRVSPEELTWQAITNIQVYGKPIDRLTFSIPASMDIVSINSTGLEGWGFEPNEADQRTILTLSYRQPFREPRQIVFRGVSTTPTGKPWAVPNLTLSSATAHTSRLIVQHAPTLRLRADRMEGVRRIAASEEAAAEILNDAGTVTPASEHWQSQFFAAWEENFTLSFVTQPKARELQAAIATQFLATSSGLELHAGISVEPRFAPLFGLDVELPANWSITSATAAGKTVAWRTQSEANGIRSIHLPFAAPVAPDQTIAITIDAQLIPDAWPIEDQPFELDLPELRLPTVGMVEGSYLIRSDSDLRVIPLQFTGLDPAADTVRQSRSGGSSLNYDYQDTRFSGQLRIERRPSRISATTLTFARLEPETLHAHMEAVVQISGGGLRSIRLALPEATGEDLRFLLHGDGLRIAEQQAAEVAEGERVWTLRFDQRHRGQLLLSVDVELPRGEAAEFSVPTLRVLEAERQSGFTAIEGSGEQQLTITALDAAGASLSETAAEDLPTSASYQPRERIVAAYHHVRPGQTLTIAETRFERTAVPTAICDLLMVRSVLGETGYLQHQAGFAFRAVGIQSLQVTLPEGAELWSTLVDDQPVEVRKVGDAYYVPMPISDAAEDKHALVLFYTTDAGALEPSGTLSQSPPQLAVVSGAGSVEPLEILQQSWSLHHPRDTQFVDAHDLYQPSDRDALPSVLGSLRSAFSLGDRDEFVWKAVFVISALAVLAVIVLGYRRMGMLGAAGVGLVALFFVGLLMTPAVQQARQSAPSVSGTTANPQLNQIVMGISTQRDFPQDPFEEATHGKKQADLDDYDYLSSRLGLREPDALLREGATFDFGVQSESEPERSEAEEWLELTARRQRYRIAKEKNIETQEPADAQGDGKPARRRIEKFEETSQPSSGKLQANYDDPQEPIEVDVSSVPFNHEFSFQAGNGETAPEDDQKTDVELSDSQPGSQSVEGDGAADSSPGTKLGGLLSLNVQLTPPADSRETSFRYIGAANNTAPPRLVVEYVKLRRIGTTTFAWMMGMLLLCWFLRNKLLTARAAIAAIGLAVPLSLASLAPPLWLPALDGIFLGTLAGIAVWIVIPLCKACFTDEHSLGSSIKSSISQRMATVLLVSLACTVTATAAEKPVKKPPKPPASQPTIVIPYETDSDPLKAERVFLPHEKFVELWNQAHPDRRIVAPAPVESMIAEALYAAEIDGEFVRVTGRIVAYSFRDSQVGLPLPLGAVAIDSAELDGQAAPLRSKQTKSGAHLEVLLDEPGMHVIDLKLRLPLELTGPAGRFSLPLKAVPAGLLRFKLPAADLDLRIGGARGVYRRQQTGEDTFAVIPIDQGGAIDVRWQPQQTRAGVEGVIHTEATTVLSVDDAGVQLTSTFRYEVRGGSLAEVVFSLPDGLTLRQIRGEDVGGWEIEGEGENRKLRVFLRRKVEDNTELTFDIFLANQFTDQPSTLQLPNFAPLNVTRETGRIVVYAGNQFAVTSGAVSNLAQIETENLNLPAHLLHVDPQKQTPFVAYRYTSRPFQLQLSIHRQQPALTGSARHAVLIGTRKTRIYSAMDLQLRGAPKSTITLTLPPGYLLLDAAAPNLADWSTTDVEGSKLLHLELAAPITGKLSLQITGIIPREPDDLSPALRLPTPAADELRSAVAVWLDEVYTGTMDEIGDWRSVDPERIPVDVRRRVQRPVQFAFSGVGTQLPPIGLALQRREPQLAAAGLTTIIAGDTAIEYSLAFKWKITRAAAGTFVFTTPDWLSGKLDFQGNGFRQILESPAGEGRIRWTVQLDEPLRDQFFVAANATLPPPTDGKVVAPSIEFESVVGEDGQFARLPEQQAYLILINHSRDQLDQATADAVETTSAEEVQIINLPQSLLQQAVEILRVRQADAEVTWNVRKLEQVKDLPASVNLADNLLVIAQDGSWRAQAAYRINNRSRQFLALHMPLQSRILSVYVAGKPVRPVRTTSEGRERSLIALPKTVAGDFSFTATVVFAGRLSQALPKKLQAAQLNFNLPQARVVSQQEDEKFGIPVARTLSTVYLPEDIDATVIDDPSRTNLKVVPVGLHEYDRKVSVLQEAMEMLSLPASSLSGGSKLEYNLSKIERAGQELSQLRSNSYSEAENRKLADLQRRNTAVQEKVRELRRQTVQSGKSLGANRGGRRSEGNGEPDSDSAIATNRAVSSELMNSNPDGKQDDDKNGVELEDEGQKQLFEFNFGVYEEEEDVQLGKKFRRKGKDSRGKLQSQLSEQKEQLLSKKIDKLNVVSGQRDGAESEALGLNRRRETEDPAQTGGLMLGAGVNSDSGLVGSIVIDENQATAEQWASTGGLSLLIDLPRTGQKLTLSKVGGAPKLAVGLRPRTFQETLFGIVWLVVWGGLGLGIVLALRSSSATAALVRLAPLGLMLVGGLWYFLLPMSPLGFLLLICGAAWLAVRHRHVAV